MDPILPHWSPVLRAAFKTLGFFFSSSAAIVCASTGYGLLKMLLPAFDDGATVDLAEISTHGGLTVLCFLLAGLSAYAAKRMFLVAVAGVRRSAEIVRFLIAHIAAAVLLIPAFSPTVAAAQNEAFAVVVYRDHFEARGNRFESAAELRAYLETQSVVTRSLEIRECGADQRVREAVEAIRAVVAKKAAGPSTSPFLALDMSSIRCPRP